MKDRLLRAFGRSPRGTPAELSDDRAVRAALEQTQAELAAARGERERALAERDEVQRRLDEARALNRSLVSAAAPAESPQVTSPAVAPAVELSPRPPSKAPPSWSENAKPADDEPFVRSKGPSLGNDMLSSATGVCLVALSVVGFHSSPVAAVLLAPFSVAVGFRGAAGLASRLRSWRRGRSR